MTPKDYRKMDADIVEARLDDFLRELVDRGCIKWLKPL